MKSVYISQQSMGNPHFFFFFSLFFCPIPIHIPVLFPHCGALFFHSSQFSTLKHLHLLVLPTVHSPLLSNPQFVIVLTVSFFISQSAHHSTPSLFAIYLQSYAQLSPSMSKQLNYSA